MPGLGRSLKERKVFTTIICSTRSPPNAQRVPPRKWATAIEEKTNQTTPRGSCPRQLRQLGATTIEEKSAKPRPLALGPAEATRILRHDFPRNPLEPRPLALGPAEATAGHAPDLTRADHRPADEPEIRSTHPPEQSPALQPQSTTAPNPPTHQWSVRPNPE